MKTLIYLCMGLWFLLGACDANEQINGTEDSEKEETEQTNEENDGLEEEKGKAEGKGDEQQPLPKLEEKKTVNMMIEGTTGEMEVYLHQHEQLGFSTYVPKDMAVESGDHTFNVYTNFQGDKNKDARLFMMKKSEQEITEYLEGEGFTLITVEQQTYDFSEKEYQLEREGFIGRISIFKQNKESYILGYYFPNEFADGFSPRSHILVEEIVWHNEL